MFVTDMLHVVKFALCLVQLRLCGFESVGEGFDILIFFQDFLHQFLVLCFGLLSARNGVVGLHTELGQSLIARRVRSLSRSSEYGRTGTRTSLILSMG